VYPNLRVGDAWWLPDAFTHFGNKLRHPWVIVQPYSDRRPTVIACPRTTRLEKTCRGIVIPEGVIDGFDRPGLLELRHRRVFVAREFRYFDYIGRLPEEWIRRIRDFYTGMTKGGTRR
jgi:hypothetical protein